jgi:hypothetical protein
MEKNPEFTNPTGKPYRKINSMNNVGFNSVIKSCHYTINWQTQDGYSETYQKLRVNPENDLRTRFNIDKDLMMSYPADDWRRKYAERPHDDDDPNDKDNGYQREPATTAPLYTHANKDGVTNRYLRLIRDKVNPKTTYYLVDSNGDIDDVEVSLAKLMSNITDKSYKKETDKITAETSQDEAEFLRELEKIKESTRFKFNTMLLQNIAFIIGFAKNIRTGQQEKFRWINSNIDLEGAGLDPNTKNQIIQKEYDAAKKDLPNF